MENHDHINLDRELQCRLVHIYFRTQMWDRKIWKENQHNNRQKNGFYVLKWHDKKKCETIAYNQLATNDLENLMWTYF